jgi:hypothetical protein
VLWAVKIGDPKGAAVSPVAEACMCGSRSSGPEGSFPARGTLPREDCQIHETTIIDLLVKRLLTGGVVFVPDPEDGVVVDHVRLRRDGTDVLEGGNDTKA